MKLKLVSLVILLSSGFAQAATEVCVLSQIDIQHPERFSNEQISDYQKKLKGECELSKKYQDLQSIAHSKYGIDLTDISIYQSLRYILRSDYQTAEANNTPVNKIYQTFQAYYNKSNDEKSSLIWDNFAVGIQQLEVVKDEMAHGRKFDLERLQLVHRGFYSFGSEQGDFADDPHVGVLKPPGTREIPWWNPKDDEISKDQNIIDRQNANYQDYGLIPSPKTARFSYQTAILSIAPGEKGQTVYSGDSRVNRENVIMILTALNDLLNDTGNGYHMVLGGRLITPGQFAYLAQQFYVGIHPFWDGNGRTSRFIQELILTSSGLPHGSSGDLMSDDIMTSNEDYYELAIQKNSAELDEVKACLDIYRSTRLHNKSIKEIDQQSLTYPCRILNEVKGQI